MIRSFLLCLGVLMPVWALPPFEFPTENKLILQQRPNDFFMYVNRHFEGESSKPWQAGSYGFVRTMKRTSEGVIGTKFHEGADIKPMRRDGNGVPLDPVRAVANGEVVYINPSSSRSNYGKYVVVQHNWGEGPICSLYAHLNKVTCEVGQKVATGDQLGVLGYTGVGIDKTRAHLHFEIGLMMSQDFEGWHQKYLGSASGHGNYNGLNLCGMNGIELIANQRAGKVKSLKYFLAKQKPYYSITAPVAKFQDMMAVYPWLWKSPQGNAKFAEVSFSGSGLPLWVKPSNRAVKEPTITGLNPFIGRHEDRTVKRLSGTGQSAKITDRGKRYLALWFGDY